MTRSRPLLRVLTTFAVFVVVAAGGAACHWFSKHSSVDKLPDGTQVVNVVAVVDGQPANGYRDATPAGESGSVSMCHPSPSGVSAGIYRCSPSAAQADACWKSTGETLLCVDDPWEKRLHRVTVTDPLPADPPVSSPIPFAVLLDNGVRCRIRSGGAWGGRDDGLVGAYGCAGTDDVVLTSTEGDPEPVDRSKPWWTVRTGPLGAGERHFPPPQTHTVTTAWFAAVAR